MTICCLKLKEKKKTDQYLIESGTYSTDKLASGNFQCGNIVLSSSEDNKYVVLHIVRAPSWTGFGEFLDPPILRNLRRVLRVWLGNFILLLLGEKPPFLMFFFPHRLMVPMRA